MRGKTQRLIQTRRKRHQWWMRLPGTCFMSFMGNCAKMGSCGNDSMPRSDAEEKTPMVDATCSKDMLHVFLDNCAKIGSCGNDSNASFRLGGKSHQWSMQLPGTCFMSFLDDCAKMESCGNDATLRSDSLEKTSMVDAIQGTCSMSFLAKLR